MAERSVVVGFDSCVRFLPVGPSVPFPEVWVGPLRAVPADHALGCEAAV